jgi:hypothetical protein
VAAHYIFLDHAGRVGLLGIGTAVWHLVATVSLGWPRGASTVSEETIAIESATSQANQRRRAA